MSREITRRWLSLAVALGALGGTLLVLSHYFFTRGKFIFIPYALTAVGILLAVRVERMLLFRHRFAASFLAFMLASTALYVEVLVSSSAPSPGFFGHSWRLGFLALVGAAISLAVTRLSAPAPIESAVPSPALATG